MSIDVIHVRLLKFSSIWLILLFIYVFKCLIVVIPLYYYYYYPLKYYSFILPYLIPYSPISLFLSVSSLHLPPFLYYYSFLLSPIFFFLTPTSPILLLFKLVLFFILVRSFIILFSILSLLTALFLTYISYFLVLPYMAAFDIFYLWEYT
jgi:hypothetical protein